MPRPDDDLAAHPETEHRPSAGKGVEGGNGHGQGRGSTGVDRHDTRPQAQALRHLRSGSQDGEGIGAHHFGDPDAFIPTRLGLLDIGHLLPGREIVQGERGA